MIQDEIKEQIIKRNELRKQTYNVVSETYIDMFIADLEKLLQDPDQRKEQEVEKITEREKFIIGVINSDIGDKLVYNNKSYQIVMEKFEPQKSQE